MRANAAIAPAALGFVLVACQAVVGEDFSETAHFCDPFSGQGCGSGEACHFIANGTAACVAAGTVGETGDCVADVDCASTLTCGYLQGSGYCFHLCRVARGAADCPSGQGCVPYNPPVAIDGVSFGACPP